jgi:hypothetical protein
MLGPWWVLEARASALQLLDDVSWSLLLILNL